ncbi:hypothetical protein BGZ58_008167 [Dissophora ornata]|nr:hypothetical protein BGZ58_008167 [Dissophora ornata]
MIAVGTDEQPVQAFRINALPGSISASNTVSINTGIDPETGQYIVLWSNIQDLFKGALGIKNGGREVAFLAGNDLKNLDPLRISHHPGVILEVVIESPGHDNQAISDNLIPSSPPITHTLVSSTATPCNIKASAQKSNEMTANLKTDTAEVHALTGQAVGLSFASTENTHQSLSVQSGIWNPEAQESFQAFNQLYDSYFKADLSESQMEIIKHSIEVHFDRLQAELDKNRNLRQQIHESQQQHETMRQELLEKQQHILRMEKQRLARLSIIRSRVLAVLIQTYDIHEYSIPRYFIVLPKEMRFRNRLEKPFSVRFRLHFLSECGAHTMSKDSKGQHKIHLAKHEGYDIDKPTEFFQKYGSYVLTMMQMVKYGIVVAGVVMPPLAHLKLFEGIEAAEKTLDISKRDITQLVDETITYIKAQRNKVDVDSNLSMTVTELDRLETLEGADLRQLQSFLKIKDGGDVLGNLYRIATLEGHVKWVCIDHYRENYPEMAVQQLRGIVAANGGTFIEQRAKIVITIWSRTRAEEFYGALVKARGIQELDIVLRWDATLDDLRKFSDATTMANILYLTVDGRRLKGPALDVTNRGRRCDPLIQLISNGKLRALRFRRFRQFFSRVSTSFTMMASQLQVLEIEVRNHDKEVDIRRVVSRILEGCHSLINLTMHIDDMWLSLSLDLAIEKLCKMKRLEKLTIRKTPNEEEDVIIRVSEGRIKAVEARFPSLKLITESDQEFIGKGLLTKVAAGIDYGDEALLPDLLSRNPLLTQFQIECVDASVTAAIETVASARVAILERGNASALQKLEVVAKDRGSKFPDITSMVKFREKDKTPIVSINIKKYGVGYYHGSDYLNVIFSQYGSSLEELKVKRTSDKHAQLLDGATKENGSRLILLELDPYVLTGVGLESMDRVIERSHSLRELGLHLDPDDWRKVVEAIDFLALESLSFRHSNFGQDELKILVNRISNYGDPDMPLVTLDLFNAHVGQDRMNVDIDKQLKRLKTMKPLVEIECC